MSKKFLLVIFILTATIFVFFQSKSIFGGDGGELVSAICVGGVAHPPGYPLYTILGRLANLLPWFTPAWRVSLLSSIPAAGVVTLVFYLIYRLTRCHLVQGGTLTETSAILAALIGASSLAFSYLFWLYASVPEVFSLNNLFLMILLVMTIDLISPSLLFNKVVPCTRCDLDSSFRRKLYLFSFLSGLSAAHHHFSFWFYPIFVFFIWWHNKKYWQNRPFLKIRKCCLFFLLGLLPYIYVPLTARTYPVISWGNAIDLKSFLELVTRARYGTFLSSSGVLDSSFNQRFVLVLDSFQILLKYFSPVGVILMILGFVFLFQKHRQIFWLMFLLFVAELFFLFYSGFRTDSQNIFILGMYSRFLLPLMIFGAILLSLGSFYFVKLLSRFFSWKMASFLLFLSLFSLPSSLFIKNGHKIWALKNDFTAENFGRDILVSASTNSLVFLIGDTPTFNAWYVHYCLKERPDLKMLTDNLDDKSLKKNFSNFVLPVNDENFVNNLFKNNAVKFGFFTNYPDLFPDETLVPIGLLWQYFPKEINSPSVNEISEKNRNLWLKYHDPFSGILRWFRPVTLADVLSFYNFSAKQIGLFLLRKEKIAEAKGFFGKAIEYDKDDYEAHLILGQILVKEKECQKAESELKTAAFLNESLPNPYFYLAENAKDCFKDKEKEEKYKKLYEEKKTSNEQNLNERF